WDMAAEAWWKGPEDPDIRLLTVRPQTAHYWKAPNKTAAAISMVVAAASGVKPSLGEDYKVRMS
ncbi:MAG: pyridoxamine 5'-phosphate oxidase family protein, partial [Hyphomonadaceae bacterium]